MAALEFKVNQEVILRTNLFGVIKGLIVECKPDIPRYTLKNVITLATGKDHPRPLYVHAKSIISGKVLNKPEESNHVSNVPTNELCPINEVTATSGSNGVDNFELVKHLSNDYTLIRGPCKEYTEALCKLSSLEYIGFTAEDADFRLRPLHVFAISTIDHIYIFDLLAFSTLPSDLKKLLETKRIKKITYNSDLLADSLKHHYNIKLSGLFDVQLADAYITKIKTGVSPKDLLTYEECITKYLNIPGEVFIKKPKLTEFRVVRPFTKDFLSQLARNISFAQNLSMKMYNMIFSPVYSASSYRSNVARHEEDAYEAALLLADDSTTKELLDAFNNFDFE